MNRCTPHVASFGYKVRFSNLFSPESLLVGRVQPRRRVLPQGYRTRLPRSPAACVESRAQGCGRRAQARAVLARVQATGRAGSAAGQRVAAPLGTSRGAEACRWHTDLCTTAHCRRSARRASTNSRDERAARRLRAAAHHHCPPPAQLDIPPPLRAASSHNTPEYLRDRISEIVSPPFHAVLARDPYPSRAKMTPGFGTVPLGCLQGA